MIGFNLFFFIAVGTTYVDWMFIKDYERVLSSRPTGTHTRHWLLNFEDDLRVPTVWGPY